MSLRAKHRVLIVEDSPVMRQLLSFTVRRHPEVEIEQAPDGVAALKEIKSSPAPFDLILLDLNMPVMDGIKLLHYIKDNDLTGQTVVAVITTEWRPETEEQARSLGAKYFLRKPVTRADVESILADVIGSSR
jgi:two-component system, chemotaxis family, chemotaxis protein CheY